MATPKRSTPNGTSAEIFGRIASLEGGLQSLQTELSGYAKHTSDAIASLADQISGVAEASERRLEKSEGELRDALRSTVADWKSYRDTSRPNWYALAAVFVSVAIALGSLIKSSTDAQVRPNTILTQNNAHRIEELKDQHRVELNAAIAHIREVAAIYREANGLFHKSIEARVERIENRIAVRYSEADDRQDAEIRELQRTLANPRRRQ